MLILIRCCEVEITSGDSNNVVEEMNIFGSYHLLNALRPGRQVKPIGEHFLRGDDTYQMFRKSTNFGIISLIDSIIFILVEIE